MSNSRTTFSSKPQPLVKNDSTYTVSACAFDNDAASAAHSLYQQMKNVSLSALVFHCCTSYQLDSLCEHLSLYFPNIPIIGCTSAGEITPEGYAKHSITAYGLNQLWFSVETFLLENLDTVTPKKIDDLVNEKLAMLKRKAVSSTPFEDHCFAFTLLDGLSAREELVIHALSLSLSNIPVVGGSAGDDQHFIDTKVFYNGRFYNNAAAIMVINTPCPFEVFSFHHLEPEQEKLVVTQADARHRRVHEFNAEPAAIEYCRINHLSLNELTPEVFALHPLSVQIGEKTYIRSIQQVNDDLSLTFFCAIEEGIVLTKMHSPGLVTHTSMMFNALSNKVGDINLIIGFDCIHRRVEIDERNLYEQMSPLYIKHNVIGFNTYGEQFNGLHLNHTCTGIAIGKPGDR